MSRRRILARSAPLSISLSLGVFLGCRPSPAETQPPVATCETPAEPEMDAAEDAGPAELETDIDALSKRAAELFEIPGMSVAVIADGKVVFARGYGEIERGKGQRVDADTSFAIASNTKAFTATALGLLVADGKLTWDDRVVDILPGLKLWDPWVTKALTIRDLLSHRVGTETWAGDLMWFSPNLKKADLIARLQYLPTKFGFREHYGYSNLMYMLAGEVIEKKSGQPWDAFIRARILEPLGMGELATSLPQLEGRENVAKAHILVEGEWRTTPYLDLEAVGAAAGFHASVNQMIPWMQMQLDDGMYEGKEVVPASVIRETRQPHMGLPLGAEDFLEPSRNVSAYGLGWFISDYRGELLVTHSGGMPGMISRVLLFPGANVGVVVLTSSETIASYPLALMIADLFLAEPGAKKKDYLAAGKERADAAQAADDAREIPKLEGEPPAALGGKYRNPILGPAEIRKDAEGWVFEATEHGNLTCRLFGAGEAAQPEKLPCRWEEPSMRISEFAVEWKGKNVQSVRFKVRPDFYDPLEYTFARK